MQVDLSDLQQFAKMGWVSPNGMIWHEELASSQGMSFLLFPSTRHTRKDIEETKNWLRDTRDVVHIHIGERQKKYPIPKMPLVWTPEQREKVFRDIVANRSAEMVEDCVLVDLFTASHVVQILDALSPENKIKLLGYPASKMIEITWRLIDRLPK